MDLSHWDVVTFFTRDEISYLLAGADPDGRPYDPQIEGKANLYRRLVSDAFSNAHKKAWNCVRGLTKRPDVIAPDIFDFEADELPSIELRKSVAEVMQDPSNVPLILTEDEWYTEQFQRDDIHNWATSKGIKGGYRFDGVANDRLPDLNINEKLDEIPSDIEEAFDSQLEDLLDVYWDFAEWLKVDRDVAKLNRIGNWQRIVLLDRREDGELFLSKEDKALLQKTARSGINDYVLDDQQANREWRSASIKERWVAFGIHIYCRIISGVPTEEAFYLFRLASEMIGFLSADDPDQVRESVLAVNAKAAAEARHSKPGGSRDKRKQIREIWASGKYSSRDICAEQECAALGMSFSTARKALIGTPDPS